MQFDIRNNSLVLISVQFGTLIELKFPPKLINMDLFPYGKAILERQECARDLILLGTYQGEENSFKNLFRAII